MTLDEVTRLVKQAKNEPQAAASAIAERGVAFELDEKTQKKLRKAGADDDLLAAIWKATLSGKAELKAMREGPGSSGLDEMFRSTFKRPSR